MITYRLRNLRLRFSALLPEIPSMKHHLVASLIGAFALLTVSPASAQISYPMLMSVRPVAVQTGQTSEVEIASRYNLYGAFKVLVTGSGVTGEVVPPQKAEGKTG